MERERPVSHRLGRDRKFCCSIPTRAVTNCACVQSFGEISKLVATAAAKKGLIPSDDVEVLGPEDANTLLPHGAVLFGTNARSEAVRGKELLGWAPTGESLLDEIPKAVEREAEVQQSNL